MASEAFPKIKKIRYEGPDREDRQDYTEKKLTMKKNEEPCQEEEMVETNQNNLRIRILSRETLDQPEVAQLTLKKLSVISKRFGITLKAVIEQLADDELTRHRDRESPPLRIAKSAPGRPTAKSTLPRHSPQNHS